MNLRKKTFLVMLAAVGLLAFSGTARAASVNQTILDGLGAFPAGSIIDFEFIDDSRETLINSDGTRVKRVPGAPVTYEYVGGGVATDTTLDLGDKLRGIFKAGDFSVAGGTDTAFDTSFELTAIFETEVISKTMNALGNWDFVFGPSASFATELAGYGNVTATAAELEGTMIALFEDQTPNFSVGGATQAIHEGTAIDGSPWGFLGFTGASGAAAAGEGWSFLNAGTDDITLPNSIGAGQANISVNRLAVSHSLSSGVTILPVTFGVFGPTPVEFTATATVQGPGSQSIWPLDDQTTISFSAIPSPVAIGPGLAMLGGLFFTRRRRNGLVTA